MGRPSALLLCSMIVPVLPACSGTSDSLPPEALTLRFAEILCAKVATCCDPSVVPDDWAAGCMLDENAPRYIDDQFNMRRIKEAIDTEAALYDPELGAACARRAESRSCEQFANFMTGQQIATGLACRDMLTGTFDLGTPCETNKEFMCASRTCDSEPNTRNRVCVEARADGEPCEGRCEDVFDCRHRCAGDLLCSPTGLCQRPTAPMPLGDFCVIFTQD